MSASVGAREQMTVSALYYNRATRSYALLTFFLADPAITVCLTRRCPTILMLAIRPLRSGRFAMSSVLCTTFRCRIVFSSLCLTIQRSPEHGKHTTPAEPSVTSINELVSPATECTSLDWDTLLLRCPPRQSIEIQAWLDCRCQTWRRP